MKRLRWLGWGTMGCCAVATVIACSGSSDNAGDDDIGPGSDSGSPDTSTDGNTPIDASADTSTDAGPVCTATPCVVAVSVGGRHSCAQLDDGTVRCWGDNSVGALGFGMPDGGPVHVPTPTTAVGVTDTAQLRVGGVYDGENADFSCAMNKAGMVSCWGADNPSFRSLGRGDAATANGLINPSAAPLAAPGPYVELSVGMVTSCALNSAGATFCWGFNVGSQVTIDGTTLPVAAPLQLATATPFMHVAVGAFHACGIAADKKVWCWGSPSVGELGRAPTDGGVGDIKPAPVEGLTDVVDVATGYYATCALTSDGVAHCWGYVLALGRGGDFDAGGAGSFFTQAPVAMPSGVKFTSLAAHAYGFCGLATTGDVWCWGANTFGADGPVDGGDAGNGAPVPAVAPAKVPIANVTQISSSPTGGHVCALIAGGSVKCWGLNKSEQLGTALVDGGAVFSTMPLDVHF